MNKKVKNRSDKKTFIIFIAILIVCMIAGYFTGFLFAKIENMGGFDAIRKNLGEILAPICPALFILINIMFSAITVFLYLRVKSMYSQYLKNEDDELLLDRLEDKMNLPSVFASTQMLLNLFFLSAMFEVIFFSKYAVGKDTLLLIVLLVVLFITFFIDLWIMNAVVNLDKILNPEKKGSIFDFRFGKVWEASSDEAQKVIMYRAGYDAYKTTNMVCLIMWIVALLCQFALQVGVYPSLFISIILIANNLSYLLKAMKLEKHSN